ncbi:SAM-dependent methyltransferase [Kutzneria sp. CA-103260]|nr:SAM-dependent methyltransferase [Kutzneria sp. CA-103260]
MYDYLIGGACNFAVDREWAERAIERMPWLRAAARSNRAFLRRAVITCAEAGVRQYLDLGSGIPTGESVHQMARRVLPDSRVVYVDNEEVAVAHSMLTLGGETGVGIVEADMRHVTAVLRNPVTRRLLNFEEPIGLLMTASLYYLPDADEAAAMAARYKSLLAPGSHVVLSHTTLDQRQRDMLELGAVLEMTKSLTSSATPRSREWIAAVLDGLEMLDPGLVYPSCWRPDSARPVDDTPWHDSMLAAVARKA